MAAYASLVSLMTLIEQIQNHPHPPISLQKHLVQSFSKNITFFQEFLEIYPHDVIKEAADGLESRITISAYAAEDVIESHISNHIKGGVCVSTSHEAEIELHFHEDLQKIIVSDMDALRKDVEETKKKLQKQDHQSGTHFICGSRVKIRPSAGPKNHVMVGLDDLLIEVMDKLTGDEPSLQIVPIVGMGGIGKTTLANAAYENQLASKHFDICLWVTVSQNFNMRKIFLEVLDQTSKEGSSEHFISHSSGEELGDNVYKSLYDRRYLIVMDDLWRVEPWNEMERFFPDNNNKSRIVVTTRLSYVASELSSNKIEVDFLDDHKSWNLLCQIVFAEESCPVELKESGRKIAKDCKGLPLSISVMGGLLAKSKRTQEDWVFIAKKLNPLVTLEYEGRCSHVLHWSYDYMPVHLKPCLLYMGIFPEDSEIRTSILIKMWVAEGFVKPICGRSLESAAEEYLMDLIERNLILVKLLGSRGNVKACNMHDLVRDLCIQEAEKESFLCVANKYDVGIANVHRRIAIHRRPFKHEYCDGLVPFVSHACSLLCESVDDAIVPLLRLRLLRILNLTHQSVSFREIFQPVNLRFLASDYAGNRTFGFHPSMHLFWNLQTLISKTYFFEPPFDIWRMHHLRHIKVWQLYLSDPPPHGSMDKCDHEIVLQNLQTLSSVVNFKCGTDVIRRIPNIMKLKIIYNYMYGEFSECHLRNLGCLQKLESLSFSFETRRRPSRNDFRQNVTFPHSLKKLKLNGVNLHWEDITNEIGSLPFLLVLKLNKCVDGPPEWNLVDGKFQCLKSLEIQKCDIEIWTAESHHFPRLEQLVLGNLHKLMEIPTNIGDAPNLQSIKLYKCCYAAVNSAQKIVDEQEKLGNVELKVVVWKDMKSRKYVQLHPNVGEVEN